MAVYFKLQDLEQIGVGKFRPIPNRPTLLDLWANPDGSAIVTPPSGESVIVRDGDTLGYQNGEVWVIRKPTTPYQKWKQRVHASQEFALGEALFAMGSTVSCDAFAIMADGKALDIPHVPDMSDGGRILRRFSIPEGAVAAIVVTRDSRKKEPMYRVCLFTTRPWKALNVWAAAVERDKIT